MTKTLTEQMKTEHGAWYYVKTKEWGICHWLLFPDTLDVEKDIVKILAPVPRYDEVKEMTQKIERLELDNEALEMSRDELVQKVHILNEQNTKQYNELCEEIKKNNILKKQLSIATKALKKMAKDNFQCAEQALEEIELREVK